MFTLAFFDPLSLKSPIGVISKGKSVEFKVKVDLKCIPNEMYLMLKEDNDHDYKYISMLKVDDFYKVKVYFEHSGHYFYCFKLNYNDFSKYLCKTFENYSVVLDSKGDDFFQSVLEQDYELENPIQGGLIYQIFVDRFCKLGEVLPRSPLILREDWGGEITKNTTNPVLINEEVFGGNFAGIISKLDYLESFGVTTIYLNPISLANSNHKYDTANYMQIDDMLGGEEKFKELVFEGAKRNIKIIIDGVYNHTGSDSVYFNKKKTFKSEGAYNSQNSKYFDWYNFEKFPEKYDCWWGINTLPSIKSDSLSFQNFIAGEGGVIEKFMKLGVSGIRLDVVDEISDSFTKKISDKIKSLKTNAIVLGEVWEDASTKISYGIRRKYFLNNELNSVMNYPVKNAIIDYLRSKNSNLFLATCRMIKNNYPFEVQNNLMNFLGTHDTSRIFSEIKSVCSDETIAKQLYKVAFGILFTLPGVPSIFYGDEYGMENNSGSSRACFDWEIYNNDIFEWLKNLATIRKFEVLKNGEFNIIFSSSGKFVFERFDEKMHLVVLTNLRPSPLKVNVQGNFVSFFTKKPKTDFVLQENEIEILIDKG